MCADLCCPYPYGSQTRLRLRQLGLSQDAQVALRLAEDNPSARLTAEALLHAALPGGASATDAKPLFKRDEALNLARKSNYVQYMEKIKSALPQDQYLGQQAGKMLDSAAAIIAQNGARALDSLDANYSFSRDPDKIVALPRSLPVAIGEVESRLEARRDQLEASSDPEEQAIARRGQWVTVDMGQTFSLIINGRSFHSVSLAKLLSENGE